MNTSDPKTEIQFPPKRLPGADYFWYRERAGQGPDLLTLSGRPVKDIKRQGATYDEILQSCPDGNDGIAEVGSDGRIAYYPFRKMDGKADVLEASEDAVDPVANAISLSKLAMVDFREALPVEMAEARRWLLYKLVPNSDPAKKPRKVPFYSTGAMRQGSLDSPIDIDRLAKLDEAISAFSFGDYAGLGFALGPDGTGNCWQGIDLDDLPQHPELEHVVDSLPSYTERSPSGLGMHAIGYGKPFLSLGSNGTGIEAYSGGRFFTVTGSGAGRNPLCDLSEFVETQLRPLHRRSEQVIQNNATSVEQTYQVDPKTVTELRSALLAMRSDDRSLWVKMAHALKSLDDVGRGLWLEWSATSGKFDPVDAIRVWDSVKAGQIDHRVVFAEAQRHGWINPLSREAQFRPNVGEAAPAQTKRKIDFSCVDDLDSLVVDLAWTEDIADEHPHYVERIVPEGEVTLLAGHGGAGKSFVALLMAIHVALGRSFGYLNTRRTKVLFYSAEDDRRELRRRVARICHLLSIDINELRGWLHLLDVSEIDPTLYESTSSEDSHPRALLFTLSAFVERHQIGFVVIDNASDVYGGNENFRKEVRGFIRALRTEIARPDRAVVLLAHISKFAASSKGSRDTAAEDYSGSTAWHNSVRSRLTLERDRASNCTLKHKKSNKGPLAADLGFEWRDGVPVLSGTLSIGAEAADSLLKAADNKIDEEDKAMLLAIVKDFEDRGERLPTSMQGSVTVFKSISAHPLFKKGMSKERVNELVRKLEYEKKLFRYEYKNANRKYLTAFRVVPVAFVEHRLPISEPQSNLLDLLKNGKRAFKVDLN